MMKKINKTKIFTDLFGRQFQFSDNNFNKEELDLYQNLNINWTLISIFSKENNETHLIPNIVYLLKNEFPYEDLILHENDVMTLLVYKGQLSSSQIDLIQEIKDNSKI